MEYFSALLPNGIRLVHQYVDSPVSHCGIIINTGSRDEALTEQGMAHFIEHTIFKGTLKRKSFHILSRLEDVGGELNAYTTKEETAIHASFLTEYYQRTIELFSDILINSTFPDQELKKEQDVIIDEINSYNDSPSELIFDEFEELIFEGHAIGRNILGTPENVKAFTRADIQRFMARNYNTDQMVICSVGNITGKQFAHLAERYFSIFPDNRRTFSRALVTGYAPRFKTVEKDTFQAHCLIGGLAYNVFDENRVALVLLNSILGGQSGNSRLNLALRERNGIAYNLESSYTAYSDTGTITIYFGTDKDNLDKAISLIKREIKILQNKPLGDIQISKAKKQLVGQLAMSQENHEDLMLTLGKSFMIYNKMENLDVLYKKINSVTTAQIMDIANEVLDFDKLSILIYK
ncbi:MAG TPA: pitrilysin family protein [Prolixibacteraceae bacterium]|jgi:predicted Zn-dependent peptidase